MNVPVLVLRMLREKIVLRLLREKIVLVNKVHANVDEASCLTSQSLSYGLNWLVSAVVRFKGCHYLVVLQGLPVSAVVPLALAVVPLVAADVPLSTRVPAISVAKCAQVTSISLSRRVKSASDVARW